MGLFSFFRPAKSFVSAEPTSAPTSAAAARAALVILNGKDSLETMYGAMGLGDIARLIDIEMQVTNMSSALALCEDILQNRTNKIREKYESQKALDQLKSAKAVLAPSSILFPETSQQV